jgi:hypothetical protein
MLVLAPPVKRCIYISFDKMQLTPPLWHLCPWHFCFKLILESEISEEQTEIDNNSSIVDGAMVLQCLNYTFIKNI